MDSIGHPSCKRIMTDKTPLLHKCVCFQIPIKALGLKSFNIWVGNYIFLKTMLLQREPFPITMFFTINSSPLSLPSKFVCNAVSNALKSKNVSFVRICSYLPKGILSPFLLVYLFSCSSLYPWLDLCFFMHRFFPNRPSFHYIDFLWSLWSVLYVVFVS